MLAMEALLNNVCVRVYDYILNYILNTLLKFRNFQPQCPHKKYVLKFKKKSVFCIVFYGLFGKLSTITFILQAAQELLFHSH